MLRQAKNSIYMNLFILLTNCIIVTYNSSSVVLLNRLRRRTKKVRRKREDLDDFSRLLGRSV